MDKAQGFGGWIESVGPSGALVVFGLDPAEDASRRAVHAAVAIRQAAARARRDDALRPDVSIAIHTASLGVAPGDGDVVLESEGRREACAVLDALVAAAEPGSVIVGARAAGSLGRHFELARIADPSGTEAAYRLVSYAERETPRALRRPRPRAPPARRPLRAGARRAGAGVHDRRRARDRQIAAPPGAPAAARRRRGVGRSAGRPVRPGDAVSPGRRHVAAIVRDPGRRYRRDHRRQARAAGASAGRASDPDLAVPKIDAGRRSRRSDGRHHGPEAPPSRDRQRHAANAVASGRDPAARHGARGRALDGRRHGRMGRRAWPRASPRSACCSS